MAAFQTHRLAIKVRSSVERHLRSGHPWVYAESIAKQHKEGQAGDVAVVFDQKRNQFLAVGLYDPFSPIRVRVLHAGEPVTIDAAFLHARVQEAFERRRPLLETDTDSYRLLFGEGDGVSGCIADVYAEVAVIKLYSHAWIPWLPVLRDAILHVTGCQVAVLRLSRNLQQQEEALAGFRDGQVVAGALPAEEVIFREHGLRFVANVIRGHKTGFFLDHRHNRRHVGAMAEGERVLDVFAYAGGFSVHALAGGAREVTSLDISAPALAMAERNVALNGLRAHHRILAADAFQGLAQLRSRDERYGIVVIDPPSFAKSAAEVPGARKRYQQLVELAVPLIQPGGALLMASCSSRLPAEEFFLLVEQSLRVIGRPFTELHRTEHDVDHPVRPAFPEGAYLKCGYYRLD